MSRGRPLLLTALLSCAAVMIGVAPSGAQSGPSLVIVRPAQASTSDPDVLILVELRGGGPSTVGFVAMLDEMPVRLEDAATGRFMAQGTVVAGRQAKVYVRSIPEGTHRLQVIPVSSSSVQPSAVVTFKVDAGRTSLILVIAAVAVILALFGFRRRILSPMGDRYERPRPPAPEPGDR
jgi:hypothetical protein